MDPILEAVLPLMVEWSEEQQRRILDEGQPLSEHQQALASRVGVVHPEKIRLLVVPKIPKPTHPLVLQAVAASGLYVVAAMAETIGYGVYIRRAFSPATTRILSHEFRHVHQFEHEGGSLAINVPAHQRAARIHGFNSPFEIDARMHEVDFCG